jgi:hypothetical protein
MSIPQKQQKDYEQLKTDEFLDGEIVEVQEDMEHKFTWQGKDTIMPAVRFVFRFEGYEFKHYSRWMKFLYSEKSNLFTKYITPLVKGAVVDMPFDIQGLKYMKVKVSWKDSGNGFQNIETIIPASKKLEPGTVPLIECEDLEPMEPVSADEEVPEIPF